MTLFQSEVGIFVVNGDVYIKELGNKCLISHNEKYKPIRIGESDSVYCCGRVIGTDGIISNHCRLSADLTISTDTTDTKQFTPDGKEAANATIVYNLGAIIEAIQELNRRTMFMDTNMSFAGAIHYGDVTTDVIGAEHETAADGLPGASNTNLHEHAEVV